MTSLAPISRASAVRGIAEPPTADHLSLVPMARALRGVAVPAEEAAAAGRDRTDEHAIADVVADDSGPEGMDHADRLVPDDPAGGDGMLAPCSSGHRAGHPEPGSIGEENS
jgi:hypothetical protein